MVLTLRVATTIIVLMIGHTKKPIQSTCAVGAMFASMLFLASSRLVYASPVLAKAAVITAARDFCKAAGVKPAIVVTATAPRSERVVNAHHWRPVWRVNAGPADIEVADPSGIVVAYARHFPVNAPPAGSSIGEPDAIAIAKAVLDASGQKAELADMPTTGRKAAGELAPGFPACWLVSWTRVWNGVPFRDDGANVLVDASTGAILRFAINFHAPVPEDDTETVTAEQAVGTAQKAAFEMAKSRDLVTMPPRKMAVFVALPDSKGAERVVWNCLFQAGPKKSYEVWIDVASGNNIGGGPVTTR